MDRYSFPVRLLHPRLSAGSSRRFHLSRLIAQVFGRRRQVQTIGFGRWGWYNAGNLGRVQLRKRGISMNNVNHRRAPIDEVNSCLANNDPPGAMEAFNRILEGEYSYVFRESQPFVREIMQNVFRAMTGLTTDFLVYRGPRRSTGSTWHHPTFAISFNMVTRRHICDFKPKIKRDGHAIMTFPLPKEGEDFFDQVLTGFEFRKQRQSSGTYVHVHLYPDTTEQQCEKLAEAADRVRQAYGGAALRRASPNDGEANSEPPESVENQNEFVLEKYLEDFIVSNFTAIFDDKLEMLERQYATDIGSIDILAKERKSGSFVVIELKKGRSSDNVVGQICRYMGWVKKHLCAEGQPVKGLIICRSADPKLQYALETTEHVDVRYYKVSFTLSETP